MQRSRASARRISDVRHFRSLPVIVIRRMAGNWRLLASVVIGTLIAGAILAATVIYADAIRDLGLAHALEAESDHDLDVRVSQTNIAIRAPLYEQSRERIDRAVDASLGEARGAVVRQGSTATFYPSAPGGVPNLDDDARPRANLRFRSEFLDHVTLAAGSLPSARGIAADGAIEVLLGAETARASGLGLGDRFDLHASWSTVLPPLAVEVVGLIEANDLSARHWGGKTDLLDSQTTSWPTYLFYVSQETFFGAPAQAMPSMTARYLDIYQIERERLNSRAAEGVAYAIERLEGRLGATETLLRVETDLPRVLDEFDDRLFFVRIPLFVLLLQIGGVVAYYLLVVSTMLLERQAEEIATLRSRGATTAQLLVQYGIEGAILATLAFAAGPPIAATAIAALGPTPAFSDLSGGAPLDVHLSGLSFALAGGGGLIAFASFMVPAWQATRETVVGFKRNAARPRRAPLFLRYYLDVALVVVLGLVFWRLRREDNLFDEPLFGDPHADPFLLATPAVAMLTVGIVFLRLFPLVLRLVAWLVAQGRGVALLVGTRALARNPTHYARLILMLMLATGVGMFGATFSATLDRSYDDRTHYTVGADVRASDLRGLARQGDDAFIAALATIPAQVASPVIREDGSITANGENARIEILGVDPDTFSEVAWFRSDFADGSLDAMLEDSRTPTATPGWPRCPRSRAIRAAACWPPCPGWRRTSSCPSSNSLRTARSSCTAARWPRTRCSNTRARPSASSLHKATGTRWRSAAVCAKTSGTTASPTLRSWCRATCATASPDESMPPATNSSRSRPKTWKPRCSTSRPKASRRSPSRSSTASSTKATRWKPRLPCASTGMAPG